MGILPMLHHPIIHPLVGLVARQDKPATQVARELGIPRKTHGRRRMEEQALEVLRRQVRNLHEGERNLKKAVRLVTNDRK